MSCFGHLTHIHRWQPSNCQEEEYTLNSHCSYFFILSPDSTKLLHLKARFRVVFLGIKAYAGKCSASMAFAAAYLSIFRNMVFHCKRHLCFTAAIRCKWTAMQLELTHATVFSYQPLFSGLHMVPYSQCSPLFPFCSIHFWHQTDLSSHQLSIPERQEGACY